MSDKDIAIRVENVSKVYRLGIKEQMQDNFASVLLGYVTSPLKNYRKYRSLYKFDDISMDVESAKDAISGDVIWALRNVSFDVERGEVLGVIGRNGAGKSTLLKVLSRITYPTKGRVELRGRVGSLLEVGTGFHPELTGRENIYLNATILGMKKKEVDAKIDEIIDFSGVEKFLDTPVKRYSSGMKVRLAFAVAAHLEPEILIIDEVLAVGDAAFQRKCLNKMQDASKVGRTVLFVSHNMAAVSAMCTKCILIQDGQITFEGATDEALKIYMQSVSDSARKIAIAEREDRKGNGTVKISDVYFQDQQGNQITDIALGDQVSIRLAYQSEKEFVSLRFVASIYNQYEERFMRFDTNVTPDDVKKWPKEGAAICKLLAHFALKPGQYTLNVAVFANGELADWVAGALEFGVVEGDFFGTGKLHEAAPYFYCPCHWTLG